MDQAPGRPEGRHLPCRRRPVRRRQGGGRVLRQGRRRQAVQAAGAAGRPRQRQRHPPLQVPGRRLMAGSPTSPSSPRCRPTGTRRRRSRAPRTRSRPIPDLAGIYAPWNDALQGIFSVLKQKSLLVPVGDPKHLTIVSIDGTPAGLQGGQGPADRPRDRDAAARDGQARGRGRGDQGGQRRDDLAAGRVPARHPLRARRRRRRWRPKIWGCA